jgi:toxin YoeB
MKLIFSDQAGEDYLYWQAHDRKLLERINGLIIECSRTPFKGTGKPEPLRGPLAGWWSRRITEERRLVYRPSDDGL